MLKKRFLRFSSSVIKLLLPLLSIIFIKTKINRRVINFLNDKSFNANNYYDFSNLIKNNLNNEKIIALDIGAQGGFNSDDFFHKRYDQFFEPILVEPIKDEADKLMADNKYVVDKGLWSSKTKKKINLLENRLGSSSMYQPDTDLFSLHQIKEKDYKNFDITKIVEIDCDTLSASLLNLKINKLDYLKIDTQGSELEILKGIGNFKPLLLKIEGHIHSMYKNVPGWNELIDHLYKLNYIIIDWKGIGSHATRTPAELDMIFIPNFNNFEGSSLIKNNESKFVSLLLIFGQIDLLKIISYKLDFKSAKEIKTYEDRFFN
jgi:FkbM family methyltransferase